MIKKYMKINNLRKELKLSQKPQRLRRANLTIVETLTFASPHGN
jgi:hypothetical protein